MSVFTAVLSGVCFCRRDKSRQKGSRYYGTQCGPSIAAAAILKLSAASIATDVGLCGVVDWFNASRSTLCNDNRQIVRTRMSLLQRSII